MFLLVLAMIYIFALTFIYGSAAIILLDKFLTPANKQGVPLSILNITGMIVLAVIAGYLSLFMKIGMVANLIVSVTAVVLYLVNRTEINLLAKRYLSGVRMANRLCIVIFMLVCALVLVESVDQPKVGDSGLYHVQTIKWIENYRVVPGLGNLHGIYAFNSMWHPLCALFGFSFFAIQSLHILNGMLLIFAVGFFLDGVADILNGSSSFTSIIKAATIPFNLFLYKHQIGSPAVDMPAALLIWVAFILCLENVNPAQTFRSRTINVITVIVALYVFTIKLSVIPVAILCLYIFYIQYKFKRWPELWLQIGLVLIIVVPWVARNIVLSGYLVYPFPRIDLFNVDWKMTYQYVSDEKRATEGWARLPGRYSRESLDMPLSELIPKWFAWLPNHYKLTIALTTVITLGYILWILCNLKQRRLSGLMKPNNIVYLTASAGTLYWFIMAPEPRYVFGFMLFMCVMPILPLLQRLVIQFALLARVLVLAVILLFLLHHGYQSIRNMPRSADMVFKPAPYPSPELYTKIIDNAVFYSPMKTDQCWYAPLPCTPIFQDKLSLRGSALESGFRIAR